PSSWNVQAGGPVILRTSDTVHYPLDGPGCDDEFASLLPSGGHLVYINGDGRTEPYTVTLFHQLRCLDIYRREYIADPPPEKPSPLIRHCMNYLRQMVLCHPNMGLESVHRTRGSVTSQPHDAVCNDWARIYEEAEQNWRAQRRFHQHSG
ncbi:hypothetical protein GLOTRDRAFT_40767, partial [Gloeophyllum trabeum ATCC 11539]